LRDHSTGRSLEGKCAASAAVAVATPGAGAGTSAAALTEVSGSGASAVAEVGKASLAATSDPKRAASLPERAVNTKGWPPHAQRAHATK